MVKNLLVSILKEGVYITPSILIFKSDKEFVSDICAEHDYVPVYSYDDGGGYITLRAIQLCPC